MVKWIIVQFIVVLITGSSVIKSTEINNDSPTDKTLLNGFPAAIWCKTAWDSEQDDEPTDNESARCEITKDGVVKYNESILWKESSTKGYFFNVSSEWENANVSILLTLVNSTYVKRVRFSVEEPESMKSQRTKWVVGYEHEIGCTVPKGLEDSVTGRLQDYMSEEQFNAITAVWRKDGKVIAPNGDPHFHLVPKDYKMGRFVGLKIPKPSFEVTPGTIQCTLEYGQRQLTAYDEHYCIQGAEDSNQPHIEPQQETYIVTPGVDVNISCHGGGGGIRNAFINWKKNRTRLCFAMKGHSQPPCSYEIAIPTFCHPATPEEVRKVLLFKRNNFTTSYTLKNATYENSGTYECTFRTSEGPVSAQLTVIVREPKARRNLRLIAVAAGCLIAMLLIFALYYWKRLEINYLRKKFEKSVETDRPVTFLVYSNDAFEQKVHDNALNDVTQWLKAQRYEYYNPSDGISCLDAGEHVVEHSLKVLQKCLSMTVILTPNLLSENTLEVFKIYAGFEDNVKRNFPIIFICTKKMEKLIFSNSSTEEEEEEEMEKGQNVEVVKTLRRFMKRNKETVIRWKPGGSPKFYRHLYVAFPKARPKNQTTSKYSKGREDSGKVPV